MNDLHTTHANRGEMPTVAHTVPALDLTPSRLPHLVDQAREHAAPEPRTWTYTRHSDHATVPVTCPTWCTNDHAMDQYLPTAPADIHHQAYGKEASVQATEAYEAYEARRLLSAQLAVVPDAETSEAERVPHVKVEVVDDLWSRPMGPDALADFINVVAGQLDELRALHTRLVAVRAERQTDASVINDQLVSEAEARALVIVNIGAARGGSEPR